MDKVRSNMRTQRDVYDFIAQSNGPADEYAFVFEDDLMLAPEVPPSTVLPLLACGASLSLRHRLPLFYAGSCGPRDMDGRVILDEHQAARRLRPPRRISRLWAPRLVVKIDTKNRHASKRTDP